MYDHILRMSTTQDANGCYEIIEIRPSWCYEVQADDVTVVTDSNERHPQMIDYYPDYYTGRRIVWNGSSIEDFTE